MEKNGKMRKQKKEKNTTPLQNINGGSPVIHKPSTQKTSDFSSSASCSSSAAAVPREALKSCSKKSSLSSKTPYSSSSSRTQFQNMPNANFYRTASATKLLSKYKANEIPRKPLSQISKRDPPQSQNRKTIAKPISKNGQRSKLAAVQNKKTNEFGEGPEEFLSNLNKNSQDSGPTLGNMTSNPNSGGNCSPVPKSALNPVNFETQMVDFSLREVDKKNSSCCSTAVKTPPVVASMSPEIQSQSRSKILVLKPEATTPVFYGAGHLVSGVTDRRKCRRRGSLKGFEKTNLFHEKGDLINGSGDFLIPLPAEASVRWLSSPCDEEHKAFDHVLGEKASALVCVDSRSPSKSDSDESIWPISPLAAGDTGNLIDDYPALSVSSLSGGNIIRTAISNLGSHEHGRLVWSKIRTTTESLYKVDLSNWDPAISQENAVDSISSSWVSSSALDNLSMSRVKISWRDSPSGGISENDEFECCWLLSDEKAGGSCCEKKELDNDEDSGFRMKNGSWLLDYEPQICAKGKQKSMSNEATVCAESILTDGGGVAASSDSDWTYCRESHLFQVGGHRI